MKTMSDMDTQDLAEIAYRLQSAHTNVLETTSLFDKYGLKDFTDPLQVLADNLKFLAASTEEMYQIQGRKREKARRNA